MKHALKTMGLLALVGTAPVFCWTVPAQAGNSHVEASLQSVGDLSMFYQALLNTGVINELREGETYTIFAPTNAAFTEIPRQTYPCFYSEQCRPQIAALLRNHIVVGRYDLKDLIKYDRGVRTGGGRIVYVEEPYVGDFLAGGQKVLTKSEVANNIVYRIDGVIISPQEMAQFQPVAYVPASGAVTERTVVRKTYRNVPHPVAIYPAGPMGVVPGGVTPYASVPDDATTTVIHTYTTP